ncbi:putative quinol monooxygenase [Amantichitinum ursilacus]|uniref:Putative quinol monooxygenase YgiN n=1 Tax=Amantichitinum ursilacus TaxID=857265 RepID=A0A0N0XKM2_9NEIS|nr:putative quinol monooxygenase [Amantichitinum ursilacus]KPC54281.1 putative quinol monooxygenase YgiN [Amantichitinum ursilacus]
MITVIAEINCHPGQRAAVLQAFERLLPSVLAEPGCGGYQPLVDIEGQAPWQALAPDTIFMLEQWQDMAALNAHMQMPHMAAHKEATQDLIVDVKVRILDKAL